MAYDNCYIFIRGYIGADVKTLGTDKNNKNFIRFSVAVNNNKGASTWYQVTVYNDLARALINKQRVIKGYEAVVKGIPVFSTYKDKNGIAKPSFGIFADWISIQEKLLEKGKHFDDLEKAKQIDDQVSDEDINEIEAPF
jgi:single-stranded DNA-binding protein